MFGGTLNVSDGWEAHGIHYQNFIKASKKKYRGFLVL